MGICLGRSQQDVLIVWMNDVAERVKVIFKP